MKSRLQFGKRESILIEFSNPIIAHWSGGRHSLETSGGVYIRGVAQTNPDRRKRAKTVHIGENFT
jgi:hypothetical protein